MKTFKISRFTLASLSVFSLFQGISSPDASEFPIAHQFFSRPQFVKTPLWQMIRTREKDIVPVGIYGEKDKTGYYYQHRKKTGSKRIIIPSTSLERAIECVQKDSIEDFHSVSRLYKLNSDKVLESIKDVIELSKDIEKTRRYKEKANPDWFHREYNVVGNISYGCSTRIADYLDQEGGYIAGENLWILMSSILNIYLLQNKMNDEVFKLSESIAAADKFHELEDCVQNLKTDIFVLNLRDEPLAGHAKTILGYIEDRMITLQSRRAFSTEENGYYLRNTYGNFEDRLSTLKQYEDLSKTILPEEEDAIESVRIIVERFKNLLQE